MSSRADRLHRGVVAVVVAVVAALAPLTAASPALADSCSTSTGASSCTVNTQTTITGGTLTLKHTPNLYWSFVGSGTDQWASGSSSALSGCAVSGTGTACSGGTAPTLSVTDATGSGNGWSLSAYVTSSNLPTGSTLTFNGAGSATVGNSTGASTNPFAATTPANVCDKGSSCTTATAATSCSHSGLGYTSCPSYAVNLLGGTSATQQVDLYSATASSGLGTVCFGSGSATSAGCGGTTSTAFYNMGVTSNARAGTYSGAVLNLTVSSGP